MSFADDQRQTHPHVTRDRGEAPRGVAIPSSIWVKPSPSAVSLTVAAPWPVVVPPRAAESQVTRIMTINHLDTITPEAIEATRETHLGACPRQII